MLYISHRGNINTIDRDNENTVDYITEAINKGFMVEVDVWVIGGKCFLGHDEPRYLVNNGFLYNNSIWVHAKNIEALTYFLSKPNPVFYHNTDEAVLTSNGFVWTYSGKRPLLSHSIAVLPENTDYSKPELRWSAGICSDLIEQYRGDF
jgi:hypothetical protein